MRMTAGLSGMLVSLFTLILTLGAAIWLPVVLAVPLPDPGPTRSWAVTVAAITTAVLISQPWRVAIRGTRGDVSISMAIDVATMLLLNPYLAAAGSALGTGLYNFFSRSAYKHSPGRRIERALVRGLITFSAVAVGGWLFHALRPTAGPILFKLDWLPVGAAIGVRLGVRMVFYPLGMAGLRPEPVWEQFRLEWNRLPLVPFLLTTTLGGLVALLWQSQPWATVLLLGPLAATWAATREFQRLNELLGTLEEKVSDRTGRLAETVQALERRLAESEAIHTLDRAMAQALHTDEVLETIARESVRATGAGSALVTLLSDDGEHQFVRAAYGEGMRDYVGTELPIEGSLSGRVIRTGEPAISLDPPNDSRLHAGLVRSGRWRCVIEAPLRAKDRVLGVLVVATSELKIFDDQAIRLLTLLASQAGLMLENARLHARERDLAVLEERNRIARELHDSVTQVLFGLTLNLEAAAGQWERRPERAAGLVTRSQEMASEALAEMRSLIFELRPAALQEKGLALALTNHVNLFRRRQAMEVSLTLEDRERLSPAAELCLYRVAQEALQNVAKHARAQSVHVQFSVRDGWACLRVVDDGEGFRVDEPPPSASFGLLGMRERVLALGGQLSVQSSPGHGTALEARIPLEA